MNKKLNIGLFGFGVVGQGLYHILQATPSLQARIKKICVKDARKTRSIPAEHFTYDKYQLLNDPSINVIVELINDADEAYHIVKQALKQGKHVVTANKKMLAEHLEELYALQVQHGVSLLYEASACGSIPIVRNLEEYYDNELLHELSGIFNGSSNYILTQLGEKGSDYAEALKEAQDKGFAETDPRLDVEGYDAKNKLCILATHAYGKFIQPEDVFNYGISQISAFDVKLAKERGQKIKLVCRAYKSASDELFLYVLPTFIASNHPLYHVDHEYNGVITAAGFADKQFFSGKGAGGFPTGAAVLSDISALLYDYKYSYKKLLAGDLLRSSNTLSIEVYLRSEKALPIDTLGITDISEQYTGNGQHYVVGYLSLHGLLTHKSLLQESAISLVATGRILEREAPPKQDAVGLQVQASSR